MQNTFNAFTGIKRDKWQLLNKFISKCDNLYISQSLGQFAVLEHSGALTQYHNGPRSGHPR